MGFSLRNPEVLLWTQSGQDVILLTDTAPADGPYIGNITGSAASYTIDSIGGSDLNVLNLTAEVDYFYYTAG